MENLLWFLIIGVVAGWLAGTLMKGGGFGLVGDLIVGIVGAVIGGVVFGALGIGGGGLLGAILMATVGAVILILCLRLLKRA
ncbi:MAG: GlsB/YeaQ/YmgE family stress response membrane protein [Desulfovibrio sp.]|nr:GlsB/YeaQ/YmgE family stress response membrane protein [Desulfovibrio sp.]HEU6437992.1 GlsB/YeaQ/YmgE family stress response membrane protein [Nitratidesulfovibrio sp.]